MISDSTINVNVKIFEGETYSVGARVFDRPTSENILLTSSLGCDSSVYLELKYYEVFLPNAITPNNDGINDSFSVYGSSELILIKSLVLFNRWGGKVYEGQDIAPNDTVSVWYNNPATDGLYTYIVQLLMDDGKLHQLSGSLMVIR